MKTIHKILMTALCTTAMTAPAYAQDAGQDAETYDENVIIVTATRRAQDVQDIPLAVTAVSPVQLARQGVVSVVQLLHLQRPAGVGLGGAADSRRRHDLQQYRF